MPPPDRVEFAVVDVETTGLSPERDRIVEVAVARIDVDGQHVSEFSSVVNPGRWGGSKYHGLHREQIAKGPTFDEIAPELLDALDGTVVVAHNAWFDRRFLLAELTRVGLLDHDIDVVCTLRMVEDLSPGAPRRLVECCRWHGIDERPSHHALDDAWMTAELVAKLSPRWAGVFPASYRSPLAKAFGPSAAVRRELFVDERRREGRYLAGLVGRITPEALPNAANRAGYAEYLNLLDRAVSDRRLTRVEAHLLAELAEDRGLAGADIELIHRAYLAQLHRLALADGEVSESEREDLEAVAALLNVESTDS